VVEAPEPNHTRFTKLIMRTINPPTSDITYESVTPCLVLIKSPHKNLLGSVSISTIAGLGDLSAVSTAASN